MIKKIKRLIKEIDKNIYTSTLNIEQLRQKEGLYKNIKEVNSCEKEWNLVNTGSFWGGIDLDAWYKFEIEIPKQFKNQVVALFVSTGEYDLEKEETTTNPQILAYINGEVVQGFDINHREYILTNKSNGNEKYSVDLKVNSGMFPKKFHYVVKLVTIDEKTRELFYNIKVPYQVAEQLEDTDFTKYKILDSLDKTCNIIDFRIPQSDSYNESIKNANEYILENFYKKECGHDEAIASVVGHTHIDLAWLWTMAQTREKVARSFSTVLSLMDQYPEYKFMSSTPQLYEFLKEDYPQLFEKVKQRIDEGRWEANGAMWVEPDCNLISGESFVRQFLYGLKFFKEELNSDCNVLWLPDVFGYTGSLPQIMKKCGIDYFVSCKMGWNDTNRLPHDTFMWRGIDGTEVLSHMITTTYPRKSVTSYATDYNGQLFPETVMGAFNTYREQIKNNDVLVTFGYGDGGGGPTKEMLENQRRMAKGIPGCPKTEMKTVSEFLTKLDETTNGGESLAKWYGELYLETHRGTYSSMSRDKRFNRKCEISLSQVEKLSTINMMANNTEYPKNEIETVWKEILKNQFHDILPGSSIKEVYDVTKVEYEKVSADLTDLIKDTNNTIISKINTIGDSIVLFNTLGYDRTDIATIDINEITSNITNEDFHILDNGINVPYQISDQNIIMYVSDIPSIGYKTLDIVAGLKSNSPDASFSATTTNIENQFYSIIIDEKGTFVSLFDKLNNREVLKADRRGNKIVCYENLPAQYDNWNIARDYKSKSWEIDNVTAINVIEDGDVRKVIEIKKNFCNSTVIQKVIVYRDLARIDFDTYIDLKETNIIIKAEFPIDVHADKAVCDIQFGTTERTTHNNTSWDTAKYEIFAHKWVDISEENYGVSLINDCKYGYDVKDEELNLTLVKPGTFPNPVADLEEHKFIYSLYPHAGNWKDANVDKIGKNVNEPIITAFVHNENGELNKVKSFFTINCKNVVIDTIKKCENSDDIIIRLYENYNKRSNVRLETCYNIHLVAETDMLENELKSISSDDKGFDFEIKPFEIKTFKLNIK